MPLVPWAPSPHQAFAENDSGSERGRRGRRSTGGTRCISSSPSKQGWTSAHGRGANISYGRSEASGKFLSAILVCLSGSLVALLWSWCLWKPVVCISVCIDTPIGSFRPHEGPRPRCSWTRLRNWTDSKGQMGAPNALQAWPQSWDSYLVRSPTMDQMRLSPLVFLLLLAPLSWRSSTEQHLCHDEANHAEHASRRPAPLGDWRAGDISTIQRPHCSRDRTNTPASQSTRAVQEAIERHSRDNYKRGMKLPAKRCGWRRRLTQRAVLGVCSKRFDRHFAPARQSTAGIVDQ